MGHGTIKYNISSKRSETSSSPATKLTSRTKLGSSSYVEVSKSQQDALERIFCLLSNLESEQDGKKDQDLGSTHENQLSDQHLFSVLIKSKENCGELEYAQKFAVALGLDPSNVEEFARFGKEIRDIMPNIYSETSGILDLRQVDSSQLRESLKSKLKALLLAFHKSKDKKGSYGEKDQNYEKTVAGADGYESKTGPQGRPGINFKNESKTRRDSAYGYGKGQKKTSGPVSLRKDRRLSSYQSK